MNRIADYALIGNCHSAALVGRDGSVDWACFPRFDSPAVFARILDEAHGGFFSISGNRIRTNRRWYLEGTNVLVTRHECATGVFEVTDCMPVAHHDPGDPSDVHPTRAILRRVECIEGRVDVHATLAPRFEYGLFTPRFERTSPTTAEVIGGADALAVAATGELSADAEAIRAEWRLVSGDVRWIQAAWWPAHACPRAETDPDPSDFSHQLSTTLKFWRDWLGQCWYDGEHADAVHRSALALKALTYAPTGAVVAAPTTSLPETIGGIRNWDYRYAWIRDATLTLTSLYVLGFTEEAAAFKRWLERTGAGRASDLQIMYGIGGERSLPEVELGHLAGHRDSVPVRIGNGAVKQMQLDAYGQILEAAYLFGKGGGEITDSNWRYLYALVEIVRARWHDADHGIWEMRDEPRHFVHSKLNCWAALRRGSQVAELMGDPIADDWAREAGVIREYLLSAAAPNGWFHQAVGHPAVDAATLLVPAMGLLPTKHPLVAATIERVLTELGHDGLVHRYLAEDGLEGSEGAFLLCSFWLLDCLTHSGRLDEADELLERLLGLSNDVGLYSEEVDVTTGEQLGNFPQAFTHMALVLSCAHLSAAKKGLVPFDGEHDYAELALERLLSSRPG